MGSSSRDRDIADRIEGIRRDREHGASFLAREGLRILALAVEFMVSNEQSWFTLWSVGDGLARARPPMAAIKNVAQRFIAEMERRGSEWDPHLIEVELLSEMEDASIKAAQNASEFVQQGGQSSYVQLQLCGIAVFRICHGSWQDIQRAGYTV